MLSSKTVDQVRDLSIETVVDKYVTLKKAGAKWVACCPMPNHNEKTPSFYVNPAKQRFNCYGCGAGGDGIAFVMQLEGLEFTDAVQSLATQHGIEIIESEVKGKTPEQKAEGIKMLEWLGRAQKKYRAELVERPSIAQYLVNRNFTLETINDFQFGVVPDWSVITPDIRAMGEFELCEKLGLVRKTKDSDSDRFYDFLHHRITVPIHNANGLLIGFAGRHYAMADGPKYINPPASPVYDKSKTLFGLDKARKHFHTHGMAVLVEGYLDVAKLHQHGWDNAVGSCGTALTEGHAKLIRKYTDTVLVMRDGDKAGIAAMKKDIPILLEQGLIVYVVELPAGQDPDSLFDSYWQDVYRVLVGYQDGIEYLCHLWFTESAGSISAISKAVEATAELLANISNQVRREQYITAIAKKHKLGKAELLKQVTKVMQHRADERAAKEQAKTDDDVEVLPLWVDRKRLENDGFVQLSEDTKGFRAGIYFLNADNKNLFKVTNFTITPLYHIYEQSNNRRLIEVNNGIKTSVVEMPTAAFINPAQFQIELLNKGTFMFTEYMGKNQFIRITSWMMNNMPVAFELKTLGWQPEGFFAYSNAVYHDSNLLQYDDLGMIAVENKNYMSLGNSKIHRDDRGTDNPYENDLFLKYVAPRDGVTFDSWARLFMDSYGPHAPFGIAFVFLTLFKDLVTRVSRMPLLYCYGQKGSGKSQMAESIFWLFFSGTDGDKSLRKPFNMSPGQSTPYSFFNAIERFRNCPMLCNEFDENICENWKTGTLKAGYDGEGREVGDGETGKKKKTKIQKVQGTFIIMGQYLAQKDDAAISSRSIPCNFSLERVKSLTPNQINSFNELKREELAGICFLLTDLMKHRPEVQKRLGKTFGEVQAQMMQEMRQQGHRIEARLISNYSIMLAVTKTVTDLGIALPYTYKTFYAQAVERMIKHNQALKDTSIVGQFWKTIEVLFDKGLIQNGHQIMISHFPQGIDIKEGSKVSKNTDIKGEVLLMRFSNVYGEYSKYHRERSGTAAQGEETILNYLKEQTYFIGLTPSQSFTDKRTSAYAFNYTAMHELGIVLEKNHDIKETPPQDANAHTEAAAASSGQDDLPF